MKSALKLRRRRRYYRNTCARASKRMYTYTHTGTLVPSDTQEDVRARERERALMYMYNMRVIKTRACALLSINRPTSRRCAIVLAWNSANIISI